jgi:hypothetical protein
MYPQSPLETLASYAITFVAGAISVIAIAAYGKWMKHQGRVVGSVAPQ